ncbi:phage tail protein [Bradyrhizobium genosp. P]|uniref:phage tail protein n=1 Tax=Bradyrhizobium genosp. P TaxID=83641 RepID=UPI003CF81982
MSDPYLGEIQAFPYGWAVNISFNQAWMPCQGQLLPIQQFAALFSLIGTSYGGNGTSNFALPNLNACVTNSQGTGPGLQPRTIGEMMGAPSVMLVQTEMAQHTHGLQLGAGAATGAAPGPGSAANMAVIDPTFNGFVAPPGNTQFVPTAMGFTGQNQAHDNMQPYQAIAWCICYNGIFPSFTS